MQATVQLSPAVLRRLALHVEGRFALGVDENIVASVRADVPPAVARVDPETRVEAKLGSIKRKVESGG